ncbi:hypothetical protein JWV37_10425 [Sulfurospirillum sp. T05]|uniref:Phage gp6-like head-tail connector protein n=1 Tax=Sulfurospirillum tamanense TaxID=2813362 RepID=A0ABS2WU74_9BACT|nr:hypothetical protein [Sulfurospirillum tamanensis]MBN2965197.1 hypothetical protein [Sulfurospirillum tamanensis]
MTIDGDVLEIDIDMELDDVMELRNFAKPRLDYIEEIAVNGEKEDVRTSALFSLLFAIKRSKPSIKIPLIDAPSLELGTFGTLNWIH